MRTVLAMCFALYACRALEPPTKPENVCIQACVDRAAACTEGECRTGCRLALDRMIEHEGDHVVACVSSAKKRKCDHWLWAECAAKIGPHADGGPPAPPPPKDDEDL
jgi:hypothetical protein